MASTPEIGQPAPDFTLPGFSPAGRADFSLSAQHGAPVVLAFYPGDETLVCTREMCAFQHELAAFSGVGATVWGISPQTVESHEKFALHRGLTFPLLADTDKAVAKAYGVSGLLMIKRSIFVIDAHGRVAWKWVGRTGLTYPQPTEVAAVVRGLEPYPAVPKDIKSAAAAVSPNGARKKSTTRK